MDGTTITLCARRAMLAGLALLAAVVSMQGASAQAQAQAQAPGEKRIAITFDDVPRAPGAFFTVDDRTRRLIAALDRAGVEQAAFFANPGNLDQPFGRTGAAHLAAYARAGHVIANHGFGHLALTDVSAAAYLADIDAATTYLSQLPGWRPWFRHPYLNEGRQDRAKRDAVRAGLAARGLRNGYVTAEASDWHWEALTIAAVEAGKAIDRAALRDRYVAHHVAAAEFAHKLGARATGRAHAQILLLHETDLAALFIEDLVAALRATGWRIVTADDAYDDPVAARAATVDVPSAQGTLVEAVAWEQGLPAPRWYGGNDTRRIDREFAEQVLKEGKP